LAIPFPLAAAVADAQQHLHFNEMSDAWSAGRIRIYRSFLSSFWLLDSSPKSPNGYHFKRETEGAGSGKSEERYDI
jgi:hypothetical protein